MGSSGRRVKSSTEQPASPAAAASPMVSATPAGSSAKAFSRSAETGRRVAATMAAACPSTSSRVTSPSMRPSVAAKPPLVVASAAKPSEASSRADPASHGLGQQQRLGALMQGAEDPRPLGLHLGWAAGLIGTGRRDRHGRHSKGPPIRRRLIQAALPGCSRAQGAAVSSPARAAAWSRISGMAVVS